jgi:hypothetical protein
VRTGFREEGTAADAYGTALSEFRDAAYARARRGDLYHARVLARCENG